MTEGLRLFLVVQALGFSDVSLGLSGAVFVALIGSLLTAVPLSPAGLGIVEAGVVGVLHVAYGVPLPEATAIALLDRVISVFSIIIFGSIAYFFSSKPRGLGRLDAPRTPPTRADRRLPDRRRCRRRPWMRPRYSHPITRRADVPQSRPSTTPRTVLTAPTGTVLLVRANGTNG